MANLSDIMTFREVVEFRPAPLVFCPLGHACKEETHKVHIILALGMMRCRHN